MALFGGPDLPDECQARINQALGNLARWSVDDLLGRDIEVLVAEAATYFETATVHWDQVTMSEPTSLDKGMVGSVLLVPVDGDARLLTYRSHRGAPAFTTIVGDAGPGELSFRWTGDASSPPETIKTWFDQRRTQVDQFLVNNNADIPGLNQQIRDQVGRAIEARRSAELERRQLVASTPFPLTRQPGATRPAVVTRRVVRTSPPTGTPTTPFTREPALEDSTYEQILDDCVNMATVLERTSLASNGEEQFRDFLLAMLNTNFTGEVAGEVFNGSGKTDILVRVQDKNVFIGECKIYRGPASVTKAVDQLLGYVVWRDTKAALILFVKDGSFTDVVTKAVHAITNHPQCQRTLPSGEPTKRTDFVFARADDSERTIRLAFLPFRLQGAPGE